MELILFMSVIRVCYTLWVLSFFNLLFFYYESFTYLVECFGSINGVTTARLITGYNRVKNMQKIISLKSLLIALLCAYTSTLSVLAQGDDAPAPQHLIKAASGDANETKLLEDACSGNLEGIQAAIQTGVDIHCRTTNGKNTILTAAAGFGHLEVVKFLLQKYPKLIQDTANQGWNALHLAAKFGHLEVVKFLLEQDADLIETRNNSGANALDIAAYYSQRDILDYLLDFCSEREDGGLSLMRPFLRWATEHDDTPGLVWELLCKYYPLGPDNDQHEDIKALIQNTREDKEKAEEVLDIKIEKLRLLTGYYTRGKSATKVLGPRNSLEERARSPEPKRRCTNRITEEHESEKLNIIDNKPLNTETQTEETKQEEAESVDLDLELHLAITGNRVDLVRELIERGANPLGVATNGKTALQLAEFLNNQELIDLLSRQEKKEEADDEDMLHIVEDDDDGAMSDDVNQRSLIEILANYIYQIEDKATKTAITTAFWEVNNQLTGHRRPF